jgi:hypothetical protein
VTRKGLNIACHDQVTNILFISSLVSPAEIVLFCYCFTLTDTEAYSLGAAGQLMVMGLKIWSLPNLVLNQGPFDHLPNAYTNCANRAGGEIVGSGD